MDQAAWYYELNRQQIGPITLQELQNLLSRKVITEETRVWTSGMTGWQPIVTVPDFGVFAPTTQASLRPTSVTVLGILNIVFGSLNLLCTPVAVFGLMVPQPEGPFQMGAAMRIYTGIGLIVGLICAIALLASGIGLLNLKRWARQTAYVYGWFAIIWGIIALVINVVVTTPSLSGISEHETPAIISGIVGGMCGGVIGLIYPVILIIFMKRPNIIAACNR